MPEVSNRDPKNISTTVRCVVHTADLPFSLHDPSPNDEKLVAG